jgi:hypothetical protein
MRRLFPYLFAALVLLAGCGPTAKEKQTVTDMTTDMRSWGLGRQIFKLPKSFVFSTGNYVTLQYGLTADFVTAEITLIGANVNQKEFLSMVKERQTLIAAEKNMQSKDTMLQLTKQITDNRILLRYYSALENTDGCYHELHVLLVNTYFIIKTESFDQPGIAIEEARLQRLISQIRLVTDPAKTGPGFIFGPIVIDSNQDGEVATINFYDSRHDDLKLAIYINAVSKDEDPSLLGRSKEAEAHVLREGKTQLGSMHAEEWLGRSNLNDRVETRFSIESNRPVPGLTQPWVSMELDSGGQTYAWDTRHDLSVNLRHLPPETYPAKFVTSSLTDYEAISLWDAIVHSVQPRPGAVHRPKPPDLVPGPSAEQIDRDRHILSDFIADGAYIDPLKPKE